MKIYLTLALLCQAFVLSAITGATDAVRNPGQASLPSSKYMLNLPPKAVGFAKGRMDTVPIYGGPGTLEGKFQDEADLPDRQGWIGVDYTERTESMWHVDTFNCADLDPGQPGNHAWWCGAVFESCGGGDSPEGYGNNWCEFLDWYGLVLDPSVPVTVIITARLNVDVELGYDSLSLEYETQDGLATQRVYTGDTQGVYVEEFIPLIPEDYVGPGANEIHLRWHFNSDTGWSDFDCGYPSDGAAQIDLIEVYFDQGSGPYQIGWTETCEPIDPVQWQPVIPPSVGDFSQVWPGLLDLDDDQDNSSPQFAFIDDGLIVTGSGPYYGTSWTYGPSSCIVNPEGGAAGPDFHIHNVIQSPFIEWPEPTYDGGLLAFDVYVHELMEPSYPGIYYIWGIRSTRNANPDAESWWSPWYGPFQLGLGGPEYRREEIDVTSLLLSDRRWIQISLGILEIGRLYGYEGTDGTPGPYFDNVTFKIFPESTTPTPRTCYVAVSGYPDYGLMTEDNHKVTLKVEADPDFRGQVDLLEFTSIADLVASIMTDMIAEIEDCEDATCVINPFGEFAMLQVAPDTLLISTPADGRPFTMMAYDEMKNGGPLPQTVFGIHFNQILTDVPGIPERPNSFRLLQSHPNPFNPATLIQFDLPAPMDVKLTIYDLKGNLVCTLLDEHRNAGMHSVRWDGRDESGKKVASGVYLYRLKSAANVQCRRMILIK